MENGLPTDSTAAVASALLLVENVPPMVVLCAGLTGEETAAGLPDEKILSLDALSGPVAAALASVACKRNPPMGATQCSHLELLLAVAVAVARRK